MAIRVKIFDISKKVGQPAFAQYGGVLEAG
jgi:hypothetical protein